MPETRVDEAIFHQFPSFRRGIVIASHLNNGGADPRLESLLNAAVVNAALNPIDPANDSRVVAWIEAYRKLGVNPKKFPPAHLALLKRVQKPGVALPFISKTVAIMNENSIRGALPVGGDDLNQAGDTLELCFADGDETFAAINKPDKSEKPNAGEVIYRVAETKQIMCRRWNWRNGFITRITDKTQAMLMNIDGLGEDSEKRAIGIRDRVASMLEQYCRATVSTALLTPSQPSFIF